MRKKFFHNDTRNGFTLIELVMVIVLLGLLAGIAAPLTLELVESFQFSLDHKNLSASAEVSLGRMKREMRRLKNGTSVVTANAGTYRFVDFDNRTLQFSLNGTNLERFDGTNTDVLAANVTSLTFTYLDESLAVIATPLVSPNSTDIKFIQIDIVYSAAGNTLPLTTRIRVRNVVQQADIFT